MKKFVTMYAKFVFIILWMAIAIPFSIIFDIVKDIMALIVLLFFDKFDFDTLREDMAEIFEGKIWNLKNTLNDFIELIEGIIKN